jgi:hypothetical protein
VLAQALLQAKDATIEAQRVTLMTYQRLPGQGIAPDKDTEPLVEGIVSVSDVEVAGSGLTVHLPEILRWLKRRV